MKKLFKEFQTFIKRGNVLDLAVGVIIGGAFTAIVNALSNGILKPIINWIISLCAGGDGDLNNVYTFLKTVYQVDATTGNIVVDAAGNKVIDLASSIYIDWGAFISAIINFLLIAIVVFTIVKLINKASESLNYNLNMKKIIEKKYADKERLNKTEIRWIARMEKNHPDMFPVDPSAVTEEAEPAPAPVPEPTTNELLTEILAELKAAKTEKPAESK